MKASIAVVTNHDFGISCDGKNVEIFGAGETGKQIQKYIDDPQSDYSDALKRGKITDPVSWWIKSASRFEYQVMSYSEDNLAIAKAKIGE